jgi:hypothetical protein
VEAEREVERGGECAEPVAGAAEHVGVGAMDASGGGREAWLAAATTRSRPGDRNLLAHFFSVPRRGQKRNIRFIESCYMWPDAK